MAWTKAKMAIVASTALILAATTGTIVIKVAKNNQAPPELETRSYKIDRSVILKLQAATRSPSNTPTVKMFAEYFVSNGLKFRLPESVGFNSAMELLLVKATPSDQNKIEKIIQQLNQIPPQIHLKAYFLNVPEAAVKSLADGGTVLKTPDNNSVEIMDSISAASFLKSIERMPGSETVAEPEAVTLSGRQTQMRSGTEAIDLVPTVLTDGYTITMMAILGPPEKLKAAVNIWDDQAIRLLGPLNSDGKSRLLILVTATLVDPAGNRVHSQAEMKSHLGTIPPQP